MELTSETREENSLRSGTWSKVYIQIRRQIFTLLIILFIVFIFWALYHNGEAVYTRGL